MNKNVKTILKAAIPIIIALLSIFVLSKPASSPEFHAKTLEALDEKKTTVMELTAASTVASIAISSIPGDAATPIATEIADLSTYFLLILCAIYLEKYLVTITGYATFMILIPAACVLISANVFLKNRSCVFLAKKLITLGLAIFLAVPASVQISNIIDATYESSVQQTIEAANEAADAAEESETESTGIIDGFISKVTDTVSDAAAEAKNVLNNFIESIAIMIITSCAIPILVLLFLVWVIKVTLGVDIQLPQNFRKPKSSIEV